MRVERCAGTKGDLMMTNTSYGISIACLAGVVLAMFAAMTAFGPFAAVSEAEASGVIIFPKQDQLVQASGFGDFVTIERVDADARSSTLVRIPTDAIPL
jgi:hypothetical protein